MKSASNFWIFLILTSLLFNCATQKSGPKVLPMEKAYVLLRTEGSEKEINELTNVLNSNFVTNKIASDINYYASGRTWNINQIFTTAYNNNYDYIVLIDQVAKFTIDEKTNVGGKYKIRSYHVKSSNPDWVDLGQKTCNISVRQSIDKFSEQIISEIVPNYVAPKVTFNLNDLNSEKRKTEISAIDYNQLKSSEEIDNEIVELRKELEKEKKRTDKVIAEKEKLEKEYEEVLSFQKKKNETIIKGLESIKRKRELEEIKRQEEIKLAELKKKEAKTLAGVQVLERKRIEDERLAESKEVELRKKELVKQAEEERLAEVNRQEEIKLTEQKKKEEELRKKELERQAEEERLAEVNRQEEIKLTEQKKKEAKALAEAQALERKRIEDDRLANAKKEEERRRKELERQAEEERLAEIKRQEEIKFAELKKKEAKALAEAKALERKRIEDDRLAEVEKEEELRLKELKKKALKKEKSITIKTKKSTNKKSNNAAVDLNRSNALIIIRGQDENNNLYKDLQDNLEFELLFANIKASTQIINTEKAFDKANVLNWNKSQYQYLILINQLENKENGAFIFKVSIHSDKTDSDWKDLDNKSYDLSERTSLKEFSKTVLKSL